MSDDAASPSPPPAETPRRTHPALWGVLAAAVLLLAASLGGHGDGMYGTGLFMGPAWMWLLVPGLLVALGVLLWREART